MNIVMLLGARTGWRRTWPGRSGRAAGRPRRDGPVGDDAFRQIFRANVSACTYFWGFMAVGSTLFWAMFYLI